jgi:hypothetical protein
MADQTIPGIREDGQAVEWIEHDGGGRPNDPLTHVEVKFRDGRIERGCSAFLCWPWEEGNGPDHDDVMEWRQVPPPPTKDEIIAELLAALREVKNHAWVGKPGQGAVAKSKWVTIPASVYHRVTSTLAKASPTPLPTEASHG